LPTERGEEDTMLTLVDQASRREFLRIGGLTLGGLTLPGLLAARAASGTPGAVKDKSVIFLFMQGGPPQAETFDPKMTAPEGTRSLTGEIPTSLPGVTFGSTFGRLAPAGAPDDGRPLVRPRRQPARHQTGGLQRHRGRKLGGDLRARRRQQSSHHRHAAERALVSPARLIRARCRDSRISAGSTPPGQTG
jgi:hypothetical protein